MNVRKAVPCLKVPDMEAALAFYRDVLGFEVSDQLDTEGRPFWAQLTQGTAAIMISDRLVHDRPRLTWLYVDDADAAYAEIRAAGGRPLSGPEDEAHGCREFLIEAPDGEVYVVAQLLTQK